MYSFKRIITAVILGGLLMPNNYGVSDAPPGPESTPVQDSPSSPPPPPEAELPAETSPGK